MSTNQFDQLSRPMRDIQASDAKTHLPQILDEVERGETPIVPETDRRQAEIDNAVAAIRALRRRTGKITTEELLSFRDEGRKY